MSAADGPPAAGSQARLGAGSHPAVPLGDYFPGWPGPDPGPPAAGADASDAELAALRADFPGFRIWREAIVDRARYVARSQRWGLNPHTVVTSDLAELRTALDPASRTGSPP